MTVSLSILYQLAAQAAAVAIVFIARTIGSTWSRRNSHAWVGECAIDGRHAPSMPSREFSNWTSIHGVGLICPRCQGRYSA